LESFNGGKNLSPIKMGGNIPKDEQQVEDALLPFYLQYEEVPKWSLVVPKNNRSRQG